MAWTRSAPQRSAVAATLRFSFSPTLLHRTALSLGRGDALRGSCIGFAAFLSVAGGVAPQLAPELLAAVLFVAAGLLVGYASFTPGTPSSIAQIETCADTPAPIVAHTPPACLDDLLARAAPETLADRAAFARLTAHMSHELRTPLNAILGFSELMANEVFGPLGSSQYAAYARDIHLSGLGLLKSAEDALAITTLLSASDKAQRIQTAHPASLAAEALAFHAPAFAARCTTVNCTIDADTDVLAEQHAVRQLLINLIADATNGCAHGSNLTIASRTDNDDFEILLTLSGTQGSTATSESFSLLLARTLAELSGARLIVNDNCASDATSDWHATVRFPRAVQNDFFASAH